MNNTFFCKKIIFAKKVNPQEHINRIRKVLHYIDENIAEDLSLEKLSQIGAYSQFHFHRIFKSIIGETLLEYITRRKIEKAALQLSIKKNSSVKQIYLNLGYTSNASFTKTFKKYYGISPSKFKENKPADFSKIEQLKSKIGQNEVRFEQYLYSLNQLKNFIEMNATIEIKEMPEMHLASVMSLGIQNVEKSYEKLISWAIENKLFPKKNLKMISVYHDSFKVTAANKVRIHACMLVDEPIKSKGEISAEKIEAGKCIVGSYFVGLEDFEKSWTALFLWMNEKGYKMRPTQPFEIYHNNFKEHPEKKCIVDFCIPIF